MARRLGGLCAVLLALGLSQRAEAGMPSFGLEDVGRVLRLSELTRERLEAISFFVLVFLIASWLVQRAWNSLANGFPRMPRLSYPRALGVVLLWGLMFTLVLTMISGARELMTPGAWKQSGLTFQLVEPPRDEEAAATRMRWYKLDGLREALEEFAAERAGRFPTAEEQTAIRGEAWVIPIEGRPVYQYRPGLRSDDQAVPLAYEGSEVGPQRLVLFTNGRMTQMSAEELARALTKGERP